MSVVELSLAYKQGDEVDVGWGEILKHVSSLKLEGRPINGLRISFYNSSLTRAQYANVFHSMVSERLVQNLTVLEFVRSRIRSLELLVECVLLSPDCVLEKLHIESDLISSAGCRLLADAMKRNTTLKGLTLFNTGIGDEGAFAFADVLKVTQTLRLLNLGNHKFTHSGYKAMLDGVNANTSLTLILIGPISATSKEDREVQNAIEKKVHENLQHFNKHVQRMIQERLAAVEADEKAPWLRSKLMVVGEGFVGKTTTIKSLFGEDFQYITDSTVGISLQDAKLNAQRWKRLEKGSFLVEQLSQLGTATFSTPIDDDLTTSSSEKRQVPRTETGFSRNSLPVSALVHSNRITELEEEIADRYYDGNNRDLSVSIWDYGGQDIFQALHHLFLSRYGTYLVVFNLQEVERKDKTALSKLVQWYSSIKIHAPEAPVVLVGTFLDRTTKLEYVRSVITTLLDDSNIVFFAIDNKSSKGIPELKAYVAKVMREQGHVRLEVPIRWMRCLDELVQSPDNWLSISAVKAVSAKVGITSLGEVHDMLVLFNDLGVLAYLSETQKLQDLVILRPQWLLDAITKVIRDPAVHKFNTDELTRAQLLEDAEDYTARGVASIDLLEHLWKGEPVSFLLDLLENTLLLTEFGKHGVYLIPSMITDDTPVSLPTNGFSCTFQMSQRFGVFERLIAVCLRVEKDQLPTLRKYSIEFESSKSSGSIYITYSLTGEIHLTLSETMASEAARWLATVDSMLRKVSDSVMNSALKWGVVFESNGKQISDKQAKAEKLFPWFHQSLPSKRFSLSALAM